MVNYIFNSKSENDTLSFAKKFASKLNKKDNLSQNEYKQKICSYIGWIKYCNGKNLLNKMTKYKELLEYINTNKHNRT